MSFYNKRFNNCCTYRSTKLGKLYVGIGKVFENIRTTNYTKFPSQNILYFITIFGNSPFRNNAP